MTCPHGVKMQYDETTLWREYDQRIHDVIVYRPQCGHWDCPDHLGGEIR